MKAIRPNTSHSRHNSASKATHHSDYKPPSNIISYMVLED